MTTREAIEKLLRNAYAARQRGDLDAIDQIFAPQAEFVMAGSDASPVAVRVQGRDRYRPLISDMIKTFEILEHEIVAMLVDGSKAAVHWKAKVRSSVTGETVETDLFDLIEIENGRITSFREFCDTALVARLMQRDESTSRTMVG